MATIPVEKTKSGFPWWLLLIGALVLGVILWFALRDDTPDVLPTDPVVTEDVTAPGEPTPATPAGERLTDPAVLASVADSRDLAGRDLRFTDMRVEVAYSDSVFYATHADGPPDRRFFVVLGDPVTPGIGGPATLQIGDLVTVEGTLREPGRDDLQQWDIAADERDRLMRLEDYYVAASEVDR